MVFFHIFIYILHSNLTSLEIELYLPELKKHIHNVFLNLPYPVHLDLTSISWIFIHLAPSIFFLDPAY